MKLMGIDYGRRRIGIAVSDDGGTLARGIGVIDRKTRPDCVGELMRVINAEKPAALVFGLPLGKDDEETAMSQEARGFADALGQRAALPVHFVDESFTSKRAAEISMFRKKKTRRDKSLSDRIAACLILQEYIDRFTSPAPL
jgi:putative Holliday junction resolvase